MNHTSFSMQNILNEPIDPALCRRILEEIKSPLMEQSFALTNDQSLSNSYINPPKRPNIPPPSYNVFQKRRPAMKNKYNTYANGDSFYPAQSRYQQQLSYTENVNFLQTVANQYESHILNYNTGQAIDKSHRRFQAESIVSPLDPNITLKQQNQQWDSGLWGKLCGKLFDENEERNQQIQCSYSNSKYGRKKIFNSKQKLHEKNLKKFTQNHFESILLLPEQKSHISLKMQAPLAHLSKTVIQVSQQLHKNKHFEIADFIQTITCVIDLLKKAQSERKYLLQNIQMVYQLISLSGDQLSGLTQHEQDCIKSLTRMNFISVADMIKKISREKLIKDTNSDIRQYSKQKNKVAQTLSDMLLGFLGLQKSIEEFMLSKQAINKLKKVHIALRQKFTNSETKNTLGQMANLFRDVRLFNYQDQLHHLEYLWEDFSHKMLTEEQFINGFVRSNGIYRENNVQKGKINCQERYDNSYQEESSCIQSQLSKMGFVKN